MGILSNITRWFNNSPAQDSFEKSRDQWKGSVVYTKKRHAWEQRENQCAGSGEAPVPGSIRHGERLPKTGRRRRKGECQVCQGGFSVSRKGMVAVHKERS